MCGPPWNFRSGEPQAPAQCREPGATWQRATPAEASFDAGRCGKPSRSRLVAEDAVNPESRAVPTQSFSLAKSVTSMVFGRAWTQGLMSPSDPVGSLHPEADAAHGRLCAIWSL